MKPLQILTALSIAFLIVSPAVGVDYNQKKVCTFDNGVRPQAFNMEGRAVFFGDASLSIENEPESGWLPNKTYQVNWTLSLESVTPGFLNGTDFYILVSWTSPQDTAPTMRAETVVSQIQLSPLHKNGTLSTAFTPTNSSDGFYMNPRFPFQVYVNGEASTESWASGIWNGGGGVSNGKIGNSNTPESTVLPTVNAEFLTIVITAAVSLLAVSALVITQRLLTKRRPQQ